MDKEKTGQCFFYNEDDQLCMAISYCDKNFVVTTEIVVCEIFDFQLNLGLGT